MKPFEDHSIRTVKLIDKPTHGTFYYQLTGRAACWHTCPGCAENHKAGKIEHCGRCNEYLNQVLSGELNLV